MNTLEQIRNVIKAFESDTDMETHQALDKIKDIVAESQRFQKGEITQETYNVIMHDLECLEIPQTKSNMYHYALLKGNIQDLFGVQEVLSISEVYLEETYTRDDLYALCDYIAEEGAMLFGVVNNVACFRAERDKDDKTNYIIKEYWSSE